MSGERALVAAPSPFVLPPETIAAVAAHFGALADPTRLRLLDLLTDGERSVGELATACGSTMANVSRHLSVLRQRGLLARERRGTLVTYRIADPTVAALCERVCGTIARRLERQGEAARRFLASADSDAARGGGGDRESGH